MQAQRLAWLEPAKAHTKVRIVCYREVQRIVKSGPPEGVYCMRMTRRISTLLFLAAWCSLAPAQTPEEIWQHFANWVRNSPATTVHGKPAMDLYAERLVADGLSPEDAERRVKAISSELRLKSRSNSMLYWDAMFKFGGGPERPLRLLADVVHDLPPGRAVDVAMGNGRNSLYLASLGWKVTGYDISPEGIALARERAEKLNAKFEIVQAGHRDFNFGRERWDLIVLSYIVADDRDLETVFGRKLWESLRPGGRIVCEGNFCELLVQLLLPLKLTGLRLERYSDSDDVRDGWGPDNIKGRVIRAVIRKGP